VNNYKQQVFM